MGYLIKNNWKIIKEEICSINDFRKGNIYGDILRHHLKINRSDLAKKVVILSDADKSKEEFINLQTPSKEEKCIKLLEDFYDVIRLLPNAPMAKKYKNELTEVFEKYNLRYTVTKNCKIVLTLSGLLSSTVRLLRFSLEGNQDRLDSLDELEDKIGKLLTDYGEKDCIRVANNLMEGIAVDKAPRGNRTLGVAINNNPKLFPHNFLAECIKNLYNFSSDYKNLRHAGKSTKGKAKFTKYDGILVIGLAIAFASYMGTNDKSKLTLSGELG